MRTFKFKLKDNTEKVMDIDELTRWACLIEGLEKVTSKLEEISDSFDTDDWIKPLAFQKYIDERFHSMKHDLTVEAMMGNI
jgi:hypothetical protein